MKPLNGTSRALIEAARAAERPSDADRARVRARVMTRIAAGGVAAAAITAAGEVAGKAAAGAAASSAVGAAAGAGATLGVTKAIVAGTIAGLFVVGAAEIRRAPLPPRETRAITGASATVIVTSAPPPRAPAPEVIEPPPPAPSAIEPRAPRPEPKPPSSAGLRDEIELLKEAQKAIAGGETDRAMSLLDAHADRFKGGALAEERLAARAIALCQAAGEPGRRAEAGRAFSRFLAEAKASPLEPRVRAACADVAKE